MIIYIIKSQHNNINYFFNLKIFVLLLQANIIEKLIQKIVRLKSPKNDPLGIIGIKLIKMYEKAPSCK